MAQGHQSKKQLKEAVKYLQKENSVLEDTLNTEQHDNRKYYRGILIATRLAFVGGVVLTARWVLGYGRY